MNQNLVEKDQYILLLETEIDHIKETALMKIEQFENMEPAMDDLIEKNKELHFEIK